MKASIAVLLASCLLIAAVEPRSDARAFPSVIMIRGGGLSKPVVLHHKYNPNDPDAFARDPIVRFYSSLLSGSAAKIPEKRVQYEVAEYWGPGWVKDYGKDGRPIDGLQFMKSNRTGLLFVSPGGVLWTRTTEEPMRPGLHYLTGTKLSSDAVKVLFDAGLPRQ
jgi:hypothetical protein